MSVETAKREEESTSLEGEHQRRTPNLGRPLMIIRNDLSRLLNFGTSGKPFRGQYPGLP